jgi:hypothetical protein
MEPLAATLEMEPGGIASCDAALAVLGLEEELVGLLKLYVKLRQLPLDPKGTRTGRQIGRATRE